MRKGLLTATASVALVVVAAFAANAGQEEVNAHQKRGVSHAAVVTQNPSVAQTAGSQTIQHPVGEINNFSSSSVLHVGVNHPSKGR